jgi:peptide chain release factor subunit 1
MAQFDADLVRSLATRRAPDRSLVSCYVGLDPSTVPTARQLSSHATSLVDRLDDEARGPAGQAVRRIESYFEQDLDRRGAHGLALLASGEDEQLVDLLLPGAIEDAAHVGRTFVVSPLCKFLELDRPVVVAAVGRDRGSLWRLRRGEISDLVDLTRDGQGRHDQGGWSQARYQRARGEEARAHLQAVADELALRVPEGSDSLLAVACAQDQRAAFEGLLAPHLRDALIGYLELEKQDDASALAPGVEELLRARLRGERETLLEQWREERGQESGRATGSWAETLAAAWDGAVDMLIVEGRGTDAWDCSDCGRGYARPGTCDLDGAPLETAPGGSLESAVRGTLLHGGNIRFAGAGELDGDLGAAALLRYPVGAGARE